MLDEHRPERRRRSIRFPGYDYSQPGAYFVTICTRDRMLFVRAVMNGEMVSNGAGHIVRRWWESLPDRFQAVRLDAFVVMPNHVHGLIVIVDGGRGDS